MLSVSEQFILDQNNQANLALFGQEYNDESWAICCSDMLIKDEDTSSIVLADTLGDGKTFDGFQGKQFHYLLANPPFGVEWKDQQRVVEKEHNELGFSGRFGAGLPAINDGSLLFLQHMISKMHPHEQGDEDAVGSKIAIVFNGSPLFSGDAGSGPSNIRRWIIENDWLDAIVALPDQLFYNTGIFTYVWLVTNRKPPERRGKVQLIDQTAFTNLAISKKRKNEAAAAAEIKEGRRLQDAIRAALAKLQDKGRYMDREAFASDLDSAMKKAGVKLAGPVNKAIFTALGERDLNAEICRDSKGNAEPDGELRDTENIPLPEAFEIPNAFEEAISKPENAAHVGAKLPMFFGPDKPNEYIAEAMKPAIDDYMAREVLPHVSDAWVDYDKTKVGYEIPINRYFYVYKPPRPLSQIEANITTLEGEIAGLLKGLVE
jgi:hypothetical protein